MDKYYCSGEILPDLLADEWDKRNNSDSNSPAHRECAAEYRRVIEAGIAAGAIRKRYGKNLTIAYHNILFEDCAFSWDEIKAWAKIELGEIWPAIPFWEESPEQHIEPSSITSITPKGITKQEVIIAFQECPFSADQWKQKLADPPEWLKEYRLQKGTKSVKKHPTLWDPVGIAIALTDKPANIPIKKMDAVFVAHISLKPWVEIWRDKTRFMR